MVIGLGRAIGAAEALDNDRGVLMRRPLTVAFLAAALVFSSALGAGAQGRQLASVPEASDAGKTPGADVYVDTRTSIYADQDPTVKAWKDKLRKEARDAGAAEPSFASGDFMLAPEQIPDPNAGSAAASSVRQGVTPQASATYLYGCSLSLVLYKSSYPRATASSLTSCTLSLGTVAHEVWLWRLDWWGFDERSHGRKVAYNTRSMAYDRWDTCSDNNFNTWSARVHGDVWRGGYYYYANVSVDADLNCGGS